jgi:hypothetical protein
LVFKSELDIFSNNDDKNENYSKLVTRASSLEKYDEVDIKFYDNKRIGKIID